MHVDVDSTLVYATVATPPFPQPACMWTRTTGLTVCLVGVVSATAAAAPRACLCVPAERATVDEYMQVEYSSQLT